MKLFVFLLLLSTTAWAQKSARALAYSLLQESWRVPKTRAQALEAFKALPDIKKRLDKDALRLNVQGINFDLTYGLQGEKIDWVSWRSQGAGTQVYDQLVLLVTPAEIERARERFKKQRGHRRGQFLDVESEGVVFRFHFETRTLYSLTITDWGRGP